MLRFNRSRVIGQPTLVAWFVTFALVILSASSQLATNCINDIYSCDVPTDPPTTPTATQCSDGQKSSVAACVATAQASCDSDLSLVGEALGSAISNSYNTTCENEYCSKPFASCFGSALKNAYDNANFQSFCSAFYPLHCLTPNCVTTSARDFYQHLLDTVCHLSSMDMHCYATAVKCIDYSYFNPEVADSSIICSASAASSTCIDTTLTGTACQGVSAAASAAVTALKQSYLSECVQSDICNDARDSCLADTISTVVDPTLFQGVTCSNLNNIKTCLANHADCSFTDFVNQLQVYCAPQLCRAGIQSCYDKYQFRSSDLADSTQVYLSNFCTASSSVTACLGYRKELCDLTDFVYADLAASMDVLCEHAGDGTNVYGDSCYLEALKCVWNNLIDQATPAVFWTTTSDQLCSSRTSIQTVKTCLQTAASQCAPDDPAPVNEIYNNLVSTCVDICSSEKKTECDASMTYFLESIFKGTADGLCYLLDEQKSCFSVRMKKCSSQSVTVIQTNIAILESIFVGFSETCKTAPNPDGDNACVTAAAKCFVDFIDDLDVDMDINRNQSVCTSVSTMQDCAMSAASTCTGQSASTVVTQLIEAITAVTEMLPGCNPNTPCHLEQSVTCVESLTVQIEAAGSYMPGLNYDGSKKQKGYCRHLDSSKAMTCGCQHSDVSHVPKTCQSYDFTWGWICVDINATLDCVTTSTEHCVGAIQAQQKQSIELSAAVYIHACAVSEYTCDMESATEIIEQITDFGMQILLYPDESPNPILCATLNGLLDELWVVSIQCSPFVQQILWQFVETYVQLAVKGCLPPQLVWPPNPFPLPPWDQNTTTECSASKVVISLQEFFDTVLKESVKAVRDNEIIIDAWVEFKASIDIIVQTDTSFDAGQCTWLSTTIVRITETIEIIVDFITVPDDCHLDEAFQCANDLQYYLAAMGLEGAGNVDDVDLASELAFCQTATTKFQCIVDASASCDSELAKPAFDIFFTVQEQAGFDCVDYCQQNPCLNDGVCTSFSDHYECDCPDGFSPPNCTPTCDEDAALECVFNAAESLMAGNYEEFCSAVKDVKPCLDNVAANGACDYSIITAVINLVYGDVFTAFDVALTTDCTITPPPSDCSFETIGRDCIQPFIRDIVVFDTETKLFTTAACRSWTSIASCVSAKQCQTVLDSLTEFFSQNCRRDPPMSCSIETLIEKANELASALWRVPIAEPNKRKPDVEDPDEDEEDFGCPCGDEPDPKKPDPEQNTVDDTGHNLDIDVCGKIGSAFDEVFAMAKICGPAFELIVNETVTELIDQYLSGGQCDSPCKNHRCFSGSTCVPKQDSYGYTCECPPGYTGQFCNEAPDTSTCEVDKSVTCLAAVQAALASLLDAATAPADLTAKCNDLDVAVECLVTSFIPCGGVEFATVNMVLSVQSAVKSRKCRTAPQTSCLTSETLVCISDLLESAFSVSTADQCTIFKDAATCMQSIQDQCPDETMSDDSDKCAKTSWALFDKACEPTTCSVPNARKCLSDLYDKIQYQFGSDDLCTMGGEAESCLDEAIVDCPSNLQDRFRQKLSKLMKNVNEGCNVDPCVDNPCQYGGTCAADSTSVYGFTCTCASGFVGDFCQFAGCTSEANADCLAKIQAVYDASWSAGPVLNCDNIQPAMDCLNTLSADCPDYIVQAANIAGTMQNLLDNFCNEPRPVDEQPDTCSVSEIRSCYLSYAALSMDGQVNDANGYLEFDVFFGTWYDAYSCMTTKSTSCTATFQAVLTDLIAATDLELTDTGSCRPRILEATDIYVMETVASIQSQPTIPSVVRDALCSNMRRLITTCNATLSLCYDDDTFNDMRTTFYNDIDAMLSVCTLPCLSSPCREGATCVPLPNGDYRCDCNRGFSGKACEKEPKDCNLKDAIQCVSKLEKVIEKTKKKKVPTATLR